MQDDIVRWARRLDELQLAQQRGWEAITTAVRHVMPSEARSFHKGLEPWRGDPPTWRATRLSVEVGRRAVQISQEVFEAAGVPVPPGYVKIRAGGLRRVVKERARAVG